MIRNHPKLYNHVLIVIDDKKKLIQIVEGEESTGT